METWLLITIIVVTVVVIGVVVMMMMGGDEEEKKDMNKIIDLDDKATLDKISKEGLTVWMGWPMNAMIADEGKEGYSWIFDDKCDDILAVDILDGPPAMDEKKEEKPAEKEEGGDEKKEEKRLRDGHEEKEGEEKAEKKDAPKEGGDAKTYMSFTGKKAGECKFSMAYADATSETFADATGGDDKPKVVSFDVQVVDKEAKEGGDDKKEEKKEEGGEEEKAE